MEQGIVIAHEILPITSGSCKSHGLGPELLLDGETCDPPQVARDASTTVDFLCGRLTCALLGKV